MKNVRRQTATFSTNYILTMHFRFQALKKRGYRNLKIQIGNGEIIPNVEEAKKLGINLTYYRFKDSIRQDIIDADLIISHAGAGSCLESLDAEKPLLVVVNEDLMHNHQIELAEQLSSDGYLYCCTNSTLETTIDKMDLNKLEIMEKTDPKIFVDYLNKYMGFC